MSLEIPSYAHEMFEKGDQYVLDDSLVVAYGLQGTTPDTARDLCKRATESYAREVLGWPHGRLAKPDIFSVHEGSMEDLAACAQHFVRQLDSNPSKELAKYPFAFIAVSENQPEEATVVLARKAGEDWQMKHCLVPIEVELGMSISSLTVSDITVDDVLSQYKDQRQETKDA